MKFERIDLPATHPYSLYSGDCHATVKTPGTLVRRACVGLLPDRVRAWGLNWSTWIVTEERIKDLEARVTDLRIANGELATSVAHLTTAVDNLTHTVQVLRDTVNQGRGALWLAMAASGGVGALLVVIGKRLLASL